jgi:diguanylate cyclase (GGDEF)-like protein
MAFKGIAMKILLVEDTHSVAAVMTARLASFGHEVVLAENGQAAVEAFRGSPFDLVLMDIDMPVMNGFEATARIREYEATQKWAWTPIIFLTASGTQENMVTAIEAGGDDFMAKGLPEPVLHAKMRALARIAALRQRLSIANLMLERQANSDGLTGLFNRRWMDSQVDRHWGIALERKSPFAVLMLDVDNFKKYNDHYGHQKGDDCLKAVAHAIETVVAAYRGNQMAQEAFAARYGGEEFAVVMPDVSSELCAEIAAKTGSAIRQLKIPHETNANWGVVTVSIGGCHLPVAGGQVANVFQKADEALYRAKETGRNRFILDKH